MARPREFDEDEVLNAAIQCFWSRGYAATSIKDVTRQAGITTASLYNAFGDKRTLFHTALNHYVEDRFVALVRRCEILPPRQALTAFFDEIVRRSLTDHERKGCLLVNSAVEVAPHDAEFHKAIARVLQRMEAFFLGRIEAGQAGGAITCHVSAQNLARHLLGALMGLRVLARVRPERALLEGIAATALSFLDP